ncbi:hypothetical protein JIQ42_08345 [Leishmania sp. Namibia]|uniref:hypothetical protein n=1 Tax=Leishmania sp. Namibia TaxID=2802991 RepID=UPI001B4DEB38|nr:hypothetical protein JIQ42_08345 [Leishmania sp. Namibia]
MFAALSWLLDLDQGHAASSSSTSSTNSCSDSSDSVAGAEETQRATCTAYARAGGGLMAELHIASATAAAALSGSASEASASPPSAVYFSPRRLEESFADLEARKATLFATSPCREPPEDGGLVLRSRVGRGGTPAWSASPSPPKIVPLWSLRSYANDAVSFSPIPSPAPAPESATVATSRSASHEDERLLLVSESVILSASLSSPSGGARFAPAERVEIAKNGSSSSTTDARAAMPTRLSRILDWDKEVHSRRQASPPPGLGASQGEHAARDSTLAHERGGQIADVELEEARFVQRAMKAAWMASRPSHTPLREPRASAVARVDPSNPFLDTAIGGCDGAVPGYSIEYMQPPPRAWGAVRLAGAWGDGATATPSGAHDSMEDALRRRSTELLPDSAPATVHRNSNARGGDDRPHPLPLTSASAGVTLTEFSFAEGMRGTPAQGDADVMHLANGLVTVVLMDADDPHPQAGQSSPPLTHPLAMQVTAPSWAVQPR